MIATADPPTGDPTATEALGRLVNPEPGETVEQALERIAQVVMSDSRPEYIAAQLTAPLPGEAPEATYLRLTSSRALVRIRPLARIFGVYEETAYGWSQEGKTPSAQHLPPRVVLPRFFNPNDYPIWHLGDLLRWGEQAGKLLWVVRGPDGDWRVRITAEDWELLSVVTARLGEKRVGAPPAPPADRGFVSVRYVKLLRPGPRRTPE